MSDYIQSINFYNKFTFLLSTFWLNAFSCHYQEQQKVLNSFYSIVERSITVGDLGTTNNSSFFIRENLPHSYNKRFRMNLQMVFTHDTRWPISVYNAITTTRVLN